VRMGLLGLLKKFPAEPVRKKNFRAGHVRTKIFPEKIRRNEIFYRARSATIFFVRALFANSRPPLTRIPGTAHRISATDDGPVLNRPRVRPIQREDGSAPRMRRHSCSRDVPELGRPQECFSKYKTRRKAGFPGSARDSPERIFHNLFPALHRFFLSYVRTPEFS